MTTMTEEQRRDTDARLEKLLLGSWLIEQTSSAAGVVDEITHQRVSAVREGIRVAIEHVGRYIGSPSVEFER